MGRKEKSELIQEAGGVFGEGGKHDGEGAGAKTKSPGGSDSATTAAEERRTEAAQEENAPRLSVVEIPTPEPKKKRGRPPKSEKTKSEEAGLSLLQANIQAIIMMGFDIVAARAGEHWKIRPEEAQAIAEPAGRILDRLGITEGTNAASDYIMLAVAVAGVVVPRVMVSQELARRREAARHGNAQGQNTKVVVGGNRTQAPGNVSANVKELLSGLAVSTY